MSLLSAMLASELATELSAEQSLMSKRLAIYYREKGLKKPKLLDEESVRDIRRAYQLHSTGQAKTYKQAVQMTLGTYVEAAPPESVRSLERRLTQIEQVQSETLEKVSQILDYLQTIQARRAAQGQPPG